MAELFNYLPATSVLCTFGQYLIAFCSQLEAATDVISGKAEECVGMNVLIKSGDSRSNRSRDIRAAHVVMKNERTIVDAGQATKQQEAHHQVGLGKTHAA